MKTTTAQEKTTTAQELLFDWHDGDKRRDESVVRMPYLIVTCRRVKQHQFAIYPMMTCDDESVQMIVFNNMLDVLLFMLIVERCLRVVVLCCVHQTDDYLRYLLCEATMCKKSAMLKLNDKHTCHNPTFFDYDQLAMIGGRQQQQSSSVNQPKHR